jgi:S1-C subfamily serine protease
MRKVLTSIFAAAVIVSAAPLAKADTPVAKPFLGVAVGPAEKESGAVIQDVTPKSPADQAGLKSGDLIRKVDDKDVKDAQALVELVGSHKPGDKLTFHLMRNAKEQTVAVTLGEKPAEKGRTDKPTRTSEAFLGVWTRPLTEELKKQLGVEADKGAVVMMVMPDSPAAKAGLVRNDVITNVSDQAVTTPEELRSAVQKLGAGKDVTLKVQRGKEVKELKAHLEESPLGFGRLPRGLSPELQKRFDEMQKRLHEMEEQFAEPRE